MDRAHAQQRLRENRVVIVLFLLLVGTGQRLPHVLQLLQTLDLLGREPQLELEVLVLVGLGVEVLAKLLDVGDVLAEVLVDDLQVLDAPGYIN